MMEKRSCAQKASCGERGGGLEGEGGRGFDERGKLCMGGLCPALVGETVPLHHKSKSRSIIEDMSKR